MPTLKALVYKSSGAADSTAEVAFTLDGTDPRAAVGAGDYESAAVTASVTYEADTVPDLVAGTIDGTPDENSTEVTVSGSNESATGTYQWERDTQGNETFVNITNADEATVDLSLTSVTGGDQIRRGVADGAQAMVYTPAVTVDAVSEVSASDYNGSVTVNEMTAFQPTFSGGDIVDVNITSGGGRAYWSKSHIAISGDNSATVGVDIVGTYTVSDGSSSDTANFTISVAAQVGALPIFAPAVTPGQTTAYLGWTVTGASGSGTLFYKVVNSIPADKAAMAAATDVGTGTTDNQELAVAVTANFPEAEAAGITGGTEGLFFAFWYSDATNGDSEMYVIPFDMPVDDGTVGYPLIANGASHFDFPSPIASDTNLAFFAFQFMQTAGGFHSLVDFADGNVNRIFQRDAGTLPGRVNLTDGTNSTGNIEMGGAKYGEPQTVLVSVAPDGGGGIDVETVKYTRTGPATTTNNYPTITGLDIGGLVMNVFGGFLGAFDNALLVRAYCAIGATADAHATATRDAFVTRGNTPNPDPTDIDALLVDAAGSPVSASSIEFRDVFGLSRSNADTYRTNNDANEVISGVLQGGSF